MELNPIHQGRTAQVWRAGGMIWMISVTLFFALIDLYFAKLPLLLSIVAGAAILAITLILFSRTIKTRLLAKLLPMEKPEEAKRKAPIRKWYVIVIIIEVAAFNIAPFVLLKFDLIQYVVPVEILIASVHFIPLGRIFAMPVYYVLGISVTLITILTLAFVPASMQIGNLIAIDTIPSICFVLVNWVVITYVLYDAKKYLPLSGVPLSPSMLS